MNLYDIRQSYFDEGFSVENAELRTAHDVVSLSLHPRHLPTE